jgi:hypothetical protein
MYVVSIGLSSFVTFLGMKLTLGEILLYFQTQLMVSLVLTCLILCI